MQYRFYSATKYIYDNLIIIRRKIKLNNYYIYNILFIF